MKLGSLVGGSATVIGREATVAEAAEALIADGVGSLAVVEGRRLVGIITERDVVRAVSEGADPEEEVVADWMSETPDTFAPDVEVREAATWLLEMGYRHMPVMQDGELLGIVSIRDILWAIISSED
ncbi:MAG: CBS domain-containing protein [Actinomycetota bacterium]